MAKNILYIIDEKMGELGDRLLRKLLPKLGFLCEIYYPIETDNSIYPSSASYTRYNATPDKKDWIFVTGLITQDKARIGLTNNDPGTTDQEKRAIYTELLPLGTKIRVHIPGGRIMDLKVVEVYQDATRTRSFFFHKVEPIL